MKRWIDAARAVFSPKQSSAAPPTAPLPQSPPAPSADAQGESEALIAEGNRLEDGGELTAAEERYRLAAERAPHHLRAHLNLGNVLRLQDREPEAEAAYRRALAVDPRHLGALFNLARLLHETGRSEQSAEGYRTALQVDPGFVEGHVGLGTALEGMKRPEEAIECYREALRLRPGYAGAAYNLGRLLVDLGRLDEAEPYLHQAQPGMADDSNLLFLLSKTSYDRGETARGVDYARQASERSPDDPDRFSHFLFASNYLPDIADAELFERHRQFDSRFCAPLAPATALFGNDRDSGRRLRVGYLSGDFHGHVVARFMLPLLRAHERAAVESFCYYTGAKRDGVSDEIAAAADHWREVHDLTEEALHARIGEDAIDILVDLSGHTEGNRLRLFARRAAPIQATWLGYIGSTGLTAMDYRICDRFTDPPGLTEPLHSERLARIATCQWALPLPAALPPAVEPPLISRGYPTFASFNNAAKVNDQVIETWAAILEEAAGARLLISGMRSRGAELYVKGRFHHYGIDPARILVAPRVKYEQFLALHNEVDVALDPFPYNGGTTSLDTLAVGVPLVVLEGRRSIARGGVSLLTNLGRGDLIARDREAYVEIALRLVEDRQRLAALRRDLRTAFAASPMADPARLAREIEQLYRRMWQRWCRGEGPDHIDL